MRTVLVVVSLEALAIAYLSFVSYFSSVWFVEDSQAFSMSSLDGWLVAGFRAAIGCSVAAGFGGLLVFMNRALARWLPVTRRLALPVGGGAASVVSLGAMIGALEFAITKPYV